MTAEQAVHRALTEAEGKFGRDKYISVCVITDLCEGKRSLWWCGRMVTGWTMWEMQYCLRRMFVCGELERWPESSEQGTEAYRLRLRA